MRSIYLAGPMRGLPNFNFHEFDDAAEMLRMKGWRVYSPAEHDRASGFDPQMGTLNGFDIKKAFRWDIRAILRSDAIYMLRDWEASKGAQTEHAVATAL